MNGDATTIAGFVIPSSDPLFLRIVAIHVLLGLAAAVTGLLAMLSAKGPGRHPRFGTLYFWLLTSLFLSATALSVMRWAHAYHLFILGALAFVAAFAGRAARRRRIRAWARVHIAGMGSSYVLMLVAFYVDNGSQLPPLNQLPPWTYWALPASVGVPIIVWALLRHPIVRRQTP
ncbi:MAG TPA: hypothetical protein VJT80_05130 [Steroidobacteraceae bacterium]|nr:hypothetical protein [Steroidobacteraceae bacterium]